MHRASNLPGHLRVDKEDTQDGVDYVRAVVSRTKLHQVRGARIHPHRLVVGLKRGNAALHEVRHDQLPRETLLPEVFQTPHQVRVVCSVKGRLALVGVLHGRCLRDVQERAGRLDADKETPLTEVIHLLDHGRDGFVPTP